MRSTLRSDLSLEPHLSHQAVELCDNLVSEFLYRPVGTTHVRGRIRVTSGYGVYGRAAYTER